MSKGFPNHDEIAAAIDLVEATFGNFPNLVDCRERVVKSKEVMVKIAKFNAASCNAVIQIIHSILSLIPSYVNEDHIECKGEWQIVHTGESGWTVYSDESERYGMDGLDDYSMVHLLDELPDLLEAAARAMDEHADLLSQMWQKVRDISNQVRP